MRLTGIFEFGVRQNTAPLWKGMVMRMRSKKGKRTALVSLLITSLMLLNGCASFDHTAYLTKTEHKVQQLSAVKVADADDHMTAANEILSLAVSKEDGSFILTDKRTGTVHASAVEKDYIASANKSKLQNQMMRSPVTIYYASKNNPYVTAPKTTTVNTETEKAVIACGEIPHGIKLSINLKTSGFAFEILLELENDALKVTIPAETIRENKNNAILSMDLYPFFDSAKGDDTGYFVYPDGSGALYDFSKANHLSSSAQKNYIIPIYSENFDALEEDGPYWSVDGELEYAAALPVFGIQRNGAGVLAVLESGEADAVINIAPSGYILDINRIYPTFTYRNLFIPQQSKTSVSGTQDNAQSNVQKMEDTPIQTDKSVTYILLEEENSDYSAMARTYRERLIAQEKLPSAVSDSVQPLVLDLFMAAVEDKFPLDEYVKMTTFQQAEEILKAFSEKGIGRMYLNLSSWSRNGMGIYPQKEKPDSRLGSAGDLERLLQTAAEKNTSVLMQTNITDVRNASGGMSMRNSLAMFGNGTALTNEDANRYVYHPLAAAERMMTKILPKLPETAGVSVEKLGRLIYSNYSKNELFTRRAEAADIWRNLLAKLKADGRTVGVFGANQYGLQSADVVFETPPTDTGYTISTMSIPFLQMVLHGSVVYTSIPLNASGDLEEEKLKLLEYGYTPFFRLTYSDSKKLIFTDFNYLFSTEYHKWIETATQLVQELEKISPELHKASILRHEQLGPELAAVTYSCGVQIILNYADHPQKVNDVSIEAKSYTVLRTGGERNG